MYLYRQYNTGVLKKQCQTNGGMKMNKDLTVGKPETVLWRFCLPLFGSIIFQQLYNIADSLVAGKFVGKMHSQQSETAMRSH